MWRPLKEYIVGTAVAGLLTTGYYFLSKMYTKPEAKEHRIEHSEVKGAENKAVRPITKLNPKPVKFVETESIDWVEDSVEDYIKKSIEAYKIANETAYSQLNEETMENLTNNLLKSTGFNYRKDTDFGIFERLFDFIITDGYKDYRYLIFIDITNKERASEKKEYLEMIEKRRQDNGDIIFFHYIPFSPTDYKNAYDFIAELNEKLEYYLNKPLKLDAVSDIDKAFLADVDNDDKKEIVAFARDKDRNLEIFAVEYPPKNKRGHVKLSIKTAIKPQIEDIYVLDMTGDKKADFVFTMLSKPYPYTVIASERLGTPQGFASLYGIRDMDGNGLPEIHNRHYSYEWDGNRFVSKKGIIESLEDIKAKIVESAVIKDEKQRNDAFTRIEEEYPKEVLELSKILMLYEEPFQIAFRNYEKEPLLRMDLKEFFVMSAAQHAAIEYKKRDYEMKERALILELGGNPAIHKIVRDANGTPKLIERSDYKASSTLEQSTVTTKTWSDSYGNYEVREIALTPEAAEQIRRDRQQEIINKDPVMQVYRALDKIGNKVLSPFAPKQ